MGTRARVTTVAGAATFLCFAGVFAAGSSTAAPTPAPAAAPQTILGGCGETVQGAPGQTVGLHVAGLSAIGLGQVPSSGATVFDATSILRGVLGPLAPACQLTALALPLPAPVQTVVEPVLGAVEGTVAALPLAPQPAAPVAPAAPPPAPAALPQPAAPPPAPAAPPAVFGPVLPSFSPFALGRYQSGMPLYNYSQLLLNGPGGFGLLKTEALTSSDLLGTASGALEARQQDAAAKDVAAAGQASALPVSSSTDRVALPVLVAVLMIAAVAAALIRSWVVVTRR